LLSRFVARGFARASIGTKDRPFRPNAHTFFSHPARAAGLEKHPRFDVLSNGPGEGTQGIDGKGRAGIGEVELTENEWPKACNQGARC